MVTMVSVSRHGHDGIRFSPWSRWCLFLTLVTMVSVSHPGHNDHNQVGEHSDSGRRDDERVWGVRPADLEQGGHCTKLQIESLNSKQIFQNKMTQTYEDSPCPDQGQGAREKDDGHVHGDPDAREGSPEVHGSCQVGTTLRV